MNVVGSVILTEFMVCTWHKTVIASCVWVAQRHMQVPYVGNVTYVTYILDTVAIVNYNFVLAENLCDLHTKNGSDAWTTIFLLTEDVCDLHTVHGSNCELLFYIGRRPVWPTYWTRSDTTMWITVPRLVWTGTLRHIYNVLHCFLFTSYCWLPSNLYVEPVAGLLIVAMPLHVAQSKVGRSTVNNSYTFSWRGDLL